MGEKRGSGSLFDLLNPAATERCPANNPSSPIGHQESARQQPGDPALEAGLDLPDVIRRAHQSFDQLPVLADEKGGREKALRRSSKLQNDSNAPFEFAQDRDGENTDLPLE